MREKRAEQRALILEDESRFRGFLAEVVSEMDCTAMTAGTADEAMRLARSTPPDFVILDLNLPRVSGLAFLERFRRRFPHPPVVIITGYGDLESARAAIRLGVTDFLTKPCDLGQIEAAIDRAKRHIGGVDSEPIGTVATSRRALAKPATQPTDGLPGSDPSIRSLEDVERDAILDALRATGGNRSATARRLGISRRAIHTKIAEYRRRGYEVP